MFSETCPFLLGCPICWHIIIYSILLGIFVFLQYWLWFPLYHFLFCLFGSSLSFLARLAKGLLILFTIKKKKTLGFINFLISILFISSLIFIISFLLLTLSFFCSSFSNSFRWQVRLFIWDFSCFLRKACITVNFPLSTVFVASHRFCRTKFSLLFFSRYF